MAGFKLLSLSLFALRALGQQASTRTDPNTGITFQSYTDTTGFTFGLALPESPDKDFIGQIIGPATNGAAWAGVSLGGSMLNRLLVVAWPNGENIVSSFREASGYANPSTFSGNVSMSPISTGTFVNSTHFSYTFVCTGCITGDTLSFTNSATSSALGWALSNEAPSDVSDPDSALNYHSTGFGLFGISFTDAKSSEYATWAALASSVSAPGNSTGGDLPSGGNSTTPVTSTPTNATVSNSTYDYIIAGGGAAGIIVAERLAETGASVLLIERGKASTFASGGQTLTSWNESVTVYDVPAYGYYVSTLGDSNQFCTDTASQAGCLLGGGTMVNALMFVRPQEVDFDDKWPTGWKWDDVKSAAAQLYARNPGTISPSADGKRYDQGAYDVLSSFLSGAGFSSVDALEEPNKKHQVFTHPVWNIQNGLRAGPVMTYLPLAQAMPNFRLSLNTKVLRAIRTGSTITGVEVETATGQRQIININAGGKVILAAGALSTPRILFNSGIGPADQIQIVAGGSTAITLPEESEWINLPVGKGIKDHPIFTLKFSTKPAMPALSSTDFTNPSSQNVELFAQGSGLLSQGGQRLNFWTSIQGSDNTTRYFQGTCNGPSNNTVQIKVYLTHGLTSSGTLEIDAKGNTLFSTQPWMNTDADKDAIARFLDTLLSYSRKENSTLSYQSSSGAAANITGKDLLADYTTGSHFVASAKMGLENDGTAVVDTNTKVFGTDNLFVVDASMHPDLPTGNTQAIVMVAAEAAAARIIALGNSGNSTTIPSYTSSDGATAVATQSSTRISTTFATSATISGPAEESTTQLTSAASSTTISTSSTAPANGFPTYPPYANPPRRGGWGSGPNGPRSRLFGASRGRTASKRSAGSPDSVESEDDVITRAKWERASFLDSYKS